MQSSKCDHTRNLQTSGRRQLLAHVHQDLMLLLAVAVLLRSSIKFVPSLYRLFSIVCRTLVEPPKQRHQLPLRARIENKNRVENKNKNYLNPYLSPDLNRYLNQTSFTTTVKKIKHFPQMYSEKYLHLAFLRRLIPSTCISLV